MSTSLTHNFIIFTILSFEFNSNLVNTLNTYSSNNTFWQSTSPFIPTFNQSYGEIILHKNLKIEFDFIHYGSITGEEWSHILRIGHGGPKKDCSGRGSRFPGIFIHHTEIDRLYITISLSGSNQCWNGILEIDIPLIIGSKYHVMIQFNETYEYVSFNYDQYENQNWALPISQEFLYQPLSLWMSDEFGDPPNITLSNMTVLTWDPYTPQPTLQPTVSTQSPSISPINDPTESPTSQPSYYPTRSPSIYTTQTQVCPIYFRMGVSVSVSEKQTVKSEKLI